MMAARLPGLVVLGGVALALVAASRVVHLADGHARAAGVAIQPGQVVVRTGNLGRPQSVRSLLAGCVVLGTVGLGGATMAARGSLAWVPLTTGFGAWLMAFGGLVHWVEVVAD